MELKECREIMITCEAFEKRLINLKQIEENDKIIYPINFIMFGFPKLEIQSKEELSGRIKELEDIMNIKVEKEESD